MTQTEQPQTPRTVEDEHAPIRAPMMDSLLGYLHASARPLLRHVKITREGPRGHDPSHILLPQGYVAEVVVTGLDAPVHCTFDDAGLCYVSESGHKIDSKPRIVKVDVASGEHETFFELPDERWIKTGAFTGACWHDGSLYFMNTDTLSRLRADGTIEDLVTDLPGRGDHMSNYPAPGPDGKLYFGQGTATNAAVVGPDDYAYEWPRLFPDFHDRPGQDVTLVGLNFEAQDFRDPPGSLAKTVATGAYVPFGTETKPGQVIEGTNKPSGSIIRCNPEDMYEIEQGRWYGWPDFAAGIRLDDPYWKAGRGRAPLLAEHPDPNPPKPLVQFQDHSGPNGLDFCRHPRFGLEGQAFVALFGDIAPVTTRKAKPVGFKVVRVDVDRGEVVDFAVNKIAGPASKLPHEGFERPSHCQFGPDGALYVVDWGEIEIAPERGGIRMQKQTGTLWRIRRTEGPRGERPPKPVVVPLHALQFGAAAIGLVGVAGAAFAFARRARERSHKKKRTWRRW